MVHQVAGHRDKSLDIEAERHKLESEAKQLTLKVLKDWQQLKEEEIAVSEISGGITNLLWLLKPSKQHGLDPVVLRVFGKQTDKIIDREREAKTLKSINAAGFGAQVLATFKNGRIEAFLPMRALKPEEMVTQHMSRRIARHLRKFHAVDVKELSSQPELFSTILEWCDTARELDFSDNPKKAEAFSGIDFDKYKREITEIQDAVLQLKPRASFAHNDLLAGNVMVPEKEKETEEEGEVQFIDFEYSCTTYSTYDIANHFCEYAGFECDYSRFPGREHIAFFMTEYLQAGSSKAVEEGEVAKASAECFLFALAAHQFWGTWAILQAKYSPIDFDYMDYSGQRWKEYFKRKSEFMSIAKQLVD